MVWDAKYISINSLRHIIKTSLPHPLSVLLSVCSTEMYFENLDRFSLSGFLPWQKWQLICARWGISGSLLLGNPLYRGRIPAWGFVLIGCDSYAVLITGPCTTEACEPGQDRKVAAVSSSFCVLQVPPVRACWLKRFLIRFRLWVHVKLKASLKREAFFIN